MRAVLKKKERTTLARQSDVEDVLKAEPQIKLGGRLTGDEEGGRCAALGGASSQLCFASGMRARRCVKAALSSRQAILEDLRKLTWDERVSVRQLAKNDRAR